MNRENITATIGLLARSGYMVTYHEEIIYLHDSVGKRWAEINPLIDPMHLSIDGKLFKCKNPKEILDLLEALE